MRAAVIKTTAGDPELCFSAERRTQFYLAIKQKRVNYPREFFRESVSGRRNKSCRF
jgi:hypothetical protein